MSSPYTKKRLARLFHQQNGACCYCSGATWLRGKETRESAALRLGIPAKTSGYRQMLTAARATTEHVQRRSDGGKGGDNLKMACHACNVRRLDSEPEAHRIDMMVLVAAGLHPTNRPVLLDTPKAHLTRGLWALRKLRAGLPFT